MTALLKDPHPKTQSIHARRIDQAHWAGVAVQLRGILGKDNAFKQWEVEAIVSSLVEIAQANEPITISALKAKLHSKQFRQPEAEIIARAIVNAYG